MTGARKTLLEKIFTKSIGLISIAAVSSMIVAVAEWWALGFNSLYGLGRAANGFIMGGLLGVGLILIRYLLVSEILKKIYSGLMFWLVGFLGLVEVFCLFKFSIKIGPSLLHIVADTNNMSEITSFFGNYLDLFSGFLILGFLLLSIFVLKWANEMAKLVMENKEICTVILILVVAMSIIGVGKVGGLSGSAPMMRLFYSLKYLYKVRANLAQMTGDKTNKVELIKDEGQELEYLIFAIGESASRHFMGCYGYELDTTPYSDKLVESKNMYVFKDTISPRSSTALVMPIMLSFMDTMGNELDLQKYDPIADVFRKAKYKTYWLSNHEKITKDLSYATYLSTRCDYSVFTSKSEGNVEYFAGLCVEDGALLPHFDNYLKQSKDGEDREFYVFHLMGSHIRYRDRYPVEFAKFTASNIKDELYNSSQKNLVAEYVNTILYTDYILNEIIERVKDKTAALVYAADHAEEMWQGGFQGHGPSDISKYMVEIPMQIWLSDSFKDKYPEISKQVADAVDKPFMTDDIVHLLLNLAQIETKQYNPTRSVINPAYGVRARYVDGTKYEDLRE